MRISCWPELTGARKRGLGISTKRKKQAAEKDGEDGDDARRHVQQTKQRGGETSKAEERPSMKGKGEKVPVIAADTQSLVSSLDVCRDLRVWVCVIKKQ